MFSWSRRLDGPARAHHAAVAAGDRVYSFGGWSGKTPDRHTQMDVHAFDAAADGAQRWVLFPPTTTRDGGGGGGGRRKRPAEVPGVLYGHTAALVQHVVYIWGGIPHSDALYAFDVDAHAWLKVPRVSGNVPEGRMNHSACVSGKAMYIYGGWARNTGYTNAIYMLDTATTVWTLIYPRGTPPPATSHHTATIIGTQMFVFGGYQVGRCYNTVRVFDTQTKQWLLTPFAQRPPEERWRHSAFSYNGELYVFGGYNWSRYLNDLWRFSPETFSWKKVEPKGKGPYLTTSMGCCMLGDRVMFFGGFKATSEILEQPTDDLYFLDLVRTNPSLKTLCKRAVVQYSLDQSELPHNVRWELAAMTTNSQ